MSIEEVSMVFVVEFGEVNRDHFHAVLEAIEADFEVFDLFYQRRDLMVLVD
jgi:hypothetical protein